MVLRRHGRQQISLTIEPLASQLASIASGIDGVDVVYHVAYAELHAVVMASNNAARLPGMNHWSAPATGLQPNP
jgi:hypothetical protein